MLSLPYQTTGRGCSQVIVISFLISVMAGVVANSISKWLDRDDSDN